MEKYDIVVIGGGIVGLATAYQLSLKKPDLKIGLLEKEESLASHQTGHNSGVIHSGLYYKPGSLKAKNCVDGYNRLIQFCDENDIKYELCGKIVVATDAFQIPQLDTLQSRGAQNGLEGIKRLIREQLHEYEPHVAGLAGLYVPQTGIIDYKEVAQKYAEKFKENGGEIKLGHKVVNIVSRGESKIVQTYKGDIETGMIVNCAGLYSDKIARMTGQQLNVKIIPFRGEYFELKPEKHNLVKNLIYPVPDPNFPFLGVHFTRMINGGIEAGPNAVLAFKREGYTKSDIDIPELVESLTWPGFIKVASKYWKTGFGEMYRSFSKSAFTNALQKLMPELQESDLIPGGAGVRAQACDKDGGLIDDFLILETKGVVNVCNAPSPAATSSLAIGNTVADKVVLQLA
ncbi:L-2-hydroxyglutarate oxidase [Marinigracilibium pacificum]|uniref:L-2-hydroxyglutarate oxidase n=1 Tax=Marinigracilibium pacificum TaxID=2729599 RepID=A0A848J5H3_9BACT|nr:L-2-hydroxyglutarate oxidase [Marinigracilibium pacificum]NMM48392.1 L-2-hydroxyglutarate oxidase [Marinigracilibium pacificum]